MSEWNTYAYHATQAWLDEEPERDEGEPAEEEEEAE